MDSIFNFYFYLDRINQFSLKLRPGMQDYQEFFACSEGLSAEGRIILTILLILSKLFSYKKNPFLFFNLVSYLIRLDARGHRSAGGGTPETLLVVTLQRFDQRRQRKINRCFEPQPFGLLHDETVNGRNFGLALVVHILSHG
jgi:hypothetical protein